MVDPNLTPYIVLGLRPGATDEEIKAAFEALPPERRKDELVQRAYMWLTTPHLRSLHDETSRAISMRQWRFRRTVRLHVPLSLATITVGWLIGWLLT